MENFETELLQKLKLINTANQLETVGDVWKFIDEHFDFICSSENHAKFKDFKVCILNTSRNNMNEIRNKLKVLCNGNQIIKAQKLYLFIEHVNLKFRTYFMNEFGIFFEN
jgi:hypothetical protein